MNQSGYERGGMSKKRISLENPKEKTLHPVLIFIIVAVIATAGGYFALRLLHNAAVTPISNATENMRSQPE
jgi:hypothetical protein